MRPEYSASGNAKRAAARAGHAAIAVAFLLAVASFGCGDGKGSGGASSATTSAAPFVLVSGTAAARGLAPRAVGTAAVLATPQPIAADDEVWRRIAVETEGSLRPVLRPRGLPEGFETVLDARIPGRATPGMFTVEYAGAGRMLVIAAGPLNPPPGFEPGHQEQVTVRGQPGILAVGDDRDPNVSSWVYWEEPGMWRPEGTEPARPGALYLVQGQGMPSKELLAIVEALQARTPE